MPEKLCGFVRRAVRATAEIFTLTAILMILVFYTFGKTDPASTGAVSLFAYSLLFAGISGVFLALFSSFPRLPLGLSVFFNYLVGCFSLFLSFFLLPGKTGELRALFACAAVYTVFFAVFAAAFAFSRRKAADKRSADAYSAVFSDLKADEGKGGHQ